LLGAWVEISLGSLDVKNSLEVLYPAITAVKPSPYAARQHSRQQRAKLKSLVTKIGQVTPIIVDADYTIVDGHAVYETLRELGYEEVAVVVVHNRDEAEIRALRLALNRISEDARWDTEKLKTEFEALLSLSFDLELTGFDAVEIDMALSIDTAAANAVEEVAAEDVSVAGITVTQPGDVWRLGKHVVACADARDADRLRDLLGDVRAAVAFTDPPYNVRIDGFVSGLGKNQHREFAMASGEMSRAEFVAFLTAFLATLKAGLAEGAIAYVCMDWRHAGELMEAAATHALEIKNLCVWVKSNAGMGTFYRSQHELVFVFKHGDAPHQNHFKLGQYGRARSNVWQYRGVNAFGNDRDELLGVHPTCKPVAMIADALRDVSRRGEYVLDPFLGSGSTLMAAEEVGRVCIGVEIDPGYVDVAVRRWQKATGKDAVLAATGETFAAVAERTTAAAGAATSVSCEVGAAAMGTIDVAPALAPEGTAATAVSHGAATTASPGAADEGVRHD
jgi:DNA modification methylase